MLRQSDPIPKYRRRSPRVFFVSLEGEQRELVRVSEADVRCELPLPPDTGAIKR